MLAASEHWGIWVNSLIINASLKDAERQRAGGMTGLNSLKDFVFDFP